MKKTLVLSAHDAPKYDFGLLHRKSLLDDLLLLFQHALCLPEISKWNFASISLLPWINKGRELRNVGTVG